MYGIFDVLPDVVQVTLPSAAHVPLPFGFPPNVWVGRGARPFVVGTGHIAARGALRAALSEIGVVPENVANVFLTSALPECVGNTALFPNATIHLLTDSPLFVAASAQGGLKEDISAIAYGLVDSPERPERAGHPDWNRDTVDRFVASYFEHESTFVTVSPMSEGQRIDIGGRTLRVVATPGTDAHACCLLDEAAQVIFGGETLVRTPQPRILSPKVYSESLDRLSPLRPTLILPGYGGVERSYFALFRSLNLAVANLVQNMPFALNGPTSVAHIAFNDLGYWPSDVVRFGGSVMRFQVMLDELVRSGVAQSEGVGPWAVYAMDRPSRA